MAKQGKQLSARSQAAIKVKYEAGLMSLDKIATQHHTTRKTIIKLAKIGNWKRGKVTDKVTKKLQKRATQKLVEKEGDRLFDYSSKYVDKVDKVDKASLLNLNAFVVALKNDGGITRGEVDKLKNAQQFLKLMSDTFKTNFEGVRLAMGLDKEQSEKQPVINLVNFADANDSLE